MEIWVAGIMSFLRLYRKDDKKYVVVATDSNTEEDTGCKV